MTNHEKISVFPIGEQYFFKHYFEESVVFVRLRRYYNNRQYRFEVPADEYDEVSDFLADHGYWLATRTDFDEYVVLVKMYTNHPEGIIKRSVRQTTVDGYNCFLCKDEQTVEEMTHEGAILLTETDFDNPFVGL